MLVQEETKLTNKIIEYCTIPDERRISNYPSFSFKESGKIEPVTYRGINLLSTTPKLITKILTYIINEHTSFSEQGFRDGRPFTNAAFVIRQITEK